MPYALEKLGMLGSKASLFAADIQNTAREKNTAPISLRQRAIETLGTIGRVKGSVETLTDVALVDSELVVLKSLERMRPFEEKDIPSLGKLTRSKEAPLRSFGVIELGKFETKAKDQIPALAEALKNEQQLKIQLDIVRALGALGKNASPDHAKVAVPALLSSLKKGKGAMDFWEFEVLDVYVAGLASIGKEAVGPLSWYKSQPKGALYDLNPNIPLVAARALGRIGPDARDALPALKRAAMYPNPIGQAAIEAIRLVEKQK